MRRVPHLIIVVFIISWCSNLTAALGDLVTTITSPVAGDAFGAVINVIKKDLYITANREIAPSTGTVHQYTSSLQLVRTFHSPNDELGNYFGWSVWLGGKRTLFISAPVETVNGVSAVGRTYAFNQKTGQLLHTFERPGPAVGGELYGFRMAASTKLLAIGAVHDSALASDAGAVYLYDPVSFAYRKTLYPPVNIPNQYFGQCIMISGNRMFVSADGDSPEGERVGRIYVYDLNGNPLTTITHPLPLEADGFGLVMALSKTNLFVSQWRKQVGDVLQAGAYAVYDLKTLSFLRSVPAVDPNQGARYAGSLAALNTRLLVGSPHDFHTGPREGRGFLYDTKTNTLLKTFENPISGNRSELGEAVAFFGKYLLIGAPYGVEGGNVYVYSAK